MKELRLNDNKLNTVDSSIFKNRGLELVDLGKNSIAKVAKELNELPRLKSLNLLGNPVLETVEEKVL